MSYTLSKKLIEADTSTLIRKYSPRNGETKCLKSHHRFRLRPATQPLCGSRNLPSRSSESWDFGKHLPELGCIPSKSLLMWATASTHGRAERPYGGRKDLTFTPDMLC